MRIHALVLRALCAAAPLTAQQPAASPAVLALALDAGFASKSTFNEVFKKHTSQTPSDFREAAGA